MNSYKKKLYFIGSSFLLLICVVFFVFFRYTNQYVFLIWVASIFLLLKAFDFKFKKKIFYDFIEVFKSKIFLFVSIVYFSFRIHFLLSAKILRQHHDSAILAYNAHKVFQNFLSTGNLNVFDNAQGPITYWPAMWFYIQGFITNFLGFNVYTVRILGILSGFCILSCLWFVGIKIFKSKNLAIISCLVYSGLFPAIFFSNTSINNVPSSLFFLLSLVFVLLAEKFEPKLYLLVGLVIGFALYFYLSAMALPIIVISFLGVYLLISKFKDIKTFFKKLFYLFLGYFFSSLPYWVFSFKHYNFLNARSGCINFPHNDFYSWFALFKLQTKAMINSFYFSNFNGGGSFFVDISFFNSLFLYVLFICGFILSCFLFKNKDSFVFVIYFLVVFLLGGVLTDAVPASPRLLSLFWGASFFVGFATTIFCKYFDKILNKINVKHTNNICVVIFVLLILYYNIITYEKGLYLAKDSIDPIVEFTDIYKQEKLPVYGYVPPHVPFVLSLYLGDFNFKIINADEVLNKNIQNKHYLLVYFSNDIKINNIINNYQRISVLGKGGYTVYKYKG